MKKVKVKNLEMVEYASKKPVTVGQNGKMSSLTEVAKTPSLAMANLFGLEEKFQAALTIERYKLEPEFKLGIFEHGTMAKDDVIIAVKNKTDIGQEIVRAEMVYCQELMQSLDSGEGTVTAPKMPQIEPEPVPAYWNWVPREWWNRWRIFRNTALFCENTTDSVTSQATPYRFKHVHPAFKTRGFNNVVNQGVNDDRHHFVEAANANRVVYISGIGHGSPTTYTGHLGSPILRVGGYIASEVKGKIIHLLSCQTAKTLGPDLVRNGARAYAGYYENFTFVYDQPETEIDDMMLFWQSDSTFDIMMASGASAEDAHNATIAMYNACIAHVSGTAAATWLTHDRNYFRSPVIDACYGDKTARIHPYLVVRFPEFEVAEPVSTTPALEMENEAPELVAE